MTETWILWGLLFGSIGLGYVIYGRRQKALTPFLAGLALIVFPYFVSSVAILISLGLLLILLPFFLKI